MKDELGEASMSPNHKTPNSKTPPSDLVKVTVDQLIRGMPLPLPPIDQRNFLAALEILSNTESGMG